jgi:hypothetical protein
MYPPKIFEKIGKGDVRVVPLSEWDWPAPSTPEGAKFQQTVTRRVVEMAQRGYADSTEEEVRRLDERIPASELRIHAYDEWPPLSFTPANFPHGLLLHRDLVTQIRGAAQAFTLWRVYDVPSVALVSLREEHYVAGRLSIIVPRESVNATVRDYPAGLQVCVAPSGNCLCSLFWWTLTTYYDLETWTTDRKPDDAARLITDYAFEIAT